LTAVGKSSVSRACEENWDETVIQAGGSQSGDR
jgi:hypothetical protein